MTDALVEYDRAAQLTPSAKPSLPFEAAKIGLALRHIVVLLDGSPTAVGGTA